MAIIIVIITKPLLKMQKLIFTRTNAKYNTQYQYKVCYTFQSVLEKLDIFGKCQVSAAFSANYLLFPKS